MCYYDGDMREVELGDTILGMDWRMNRGLVRVATMVMLRPQWERNFKRLSKGMRKRNNEEFKATYLTNPAKEEARSSDENRMTDEGTLEREEARSSDGMTDEESPERYPSPEEAKLGDKDMHDE
ncbi:hypothetical protein ACLOJK_033729 [Asimina triloba]